MNKIIALFLLTLGINASSFAQSEMAVQNLKRAMLILDATMERSFRGTDTNLYMADVCDTESDEVSGPSDVWPYTAAIEAHCSVLEALKTLKDAEPELYTTHFDKYAKQLDVLIDNLTYYRGSYKLFSYASSRSWSVYAVPRASERNKANVTGDNLKFNVYDDQMWIARELIRAYLLTGKESYLEEATHLTDYVLDGWDCWRDSNGEEYGGITWGPGYNSKHACSNGPIIQPLVWLHHIYATPEEKANCNYYYRDKDNELATALVKRSDLYLDFAKKIYAWQKKNLLNEDTGVYWDMLGADGTLKYVDSGLKKRRAHVDNGPHVGNAFTYNTGTMLAGAVELLKATNSTEYSNDVKDLATKSFQNFARPKRVSGKTYYQWPTDDNALQGFNAWFDNVLMRAYVDADVTGLSTESNRSLESFQANLDYAFEHFNRHNMLPINLLSGWGDSSKTKGFHQASFAAEYAMLAVWQHRKAQAASVLKADYHQLMDDKAYTMDGRAISNSVDTLPSGLYIRKGQKLLVKR